LNDDNSIKFPRVQLFL